MNITNPTTFGIPEVTLTTANAEGTGNAVRTGASLLVYDTTLPDAITYSQSGAAGSATTSARRDHAHAMVAGTSLAAPALTLGTANSIGSAATAVSTDATILVFDTTLPAATGTAAVGSATTAPRRDHVHSSIVGESKLVQFARTASAGAGVQAITGVGFEPIAIYMIAIVHGTILYSFGFVDGDAADVCVFSTTGPLSEDVNNVIDINGGSPDNNMWAPLTSLDSDGFTVTWSKQLAGQDVLVKALCWGP